MERERDPTVYSKSPASALPCVALETARLFTNRCDGLVVSCYSRDVCLLIYSLGISLSVYQRSVSLEHAVFIVDWLEIMVYVVTSSNPPICHHHASSTYLQDQSSLSFGPQISNSSPHRQERAVPKPKMVMKHDCDIGQAPSLEPPPQNQLILESYPV